jgi:hypothetical protein
VAIDRSRESVRPWVEAAAPTHPSLIDTEWAFADLYNIVNVPTVLWIDEDGRIVRPADTAMGDDRFRAFANVDSSVHHDRLRQWVRTGERDLDDDGVRAFQERPTPEVQRARLHRRVALVLHDRGETDAARVHLIAAEQLAPFDWTIRRGNMPLEGDDPFGDRFFEFVGEWIEAGQPGYRLGTGREVPRGGS